MEQATQNSGETLSTKSAIIMILVAVLLFAAVGVGIGKIFFWGNYNKLSKVDYALAQNQERVKADPMNPNKLVLLGWTYFQKKDYEKAITYYKQALKYDDKLFSGYLNLGIAYATTGQLTKAEESYKKITVALITISCCCVFTTGPVFLVADQAPPSIGSSFILMGKPPVFGMCLRHLSSGYIQIPGTWFLFRRGIFGKINLLSFLFFHSKVAGITVFIISSVIGYGIIAV